MWFLERTVARHGKPNFIASPQRMHDGQRHPHSLRSGARRKGRRSRSPDGYHADDRNSPMLAGA